MEETDSIFVEEVEEEKRGLLYIAVALFGAVVALVRFITLKRRTWYRVVSAKDGGVFIREKAKKGRAKFAAWKLKSDGEKRYRVAFLVRRGKRMWLLYGYTDRMDEWDLTNDKEIVGCHRRQFERYLSEGERDKLLS